MKIQKEQGKQLVIQSELEVEIPNRGEKEAVVLEVAEQLQTQKKFESLKHICLNLNKGLHSYFDQWKKVSIEKRKIILARERLRLLHLHNDQQKGAFQKWVNFITETKKGESIIEFRETREEGENIQRELDSRLKSKLSSEQEKLAKCGVKVIHIMGRT